MFNKKLGNKDIKESLDNLPTGIIVAKENGVILLANKKMYDLYFQLSGKILQSIYSFLDFLNGKIINTDNVIFLKNTKVPTIIFEDNQIYSFMLKEIYLNDKKHLQLTASNVTELYNLNQKLIEKNNELKNARIKILKTKKQLKKIINKNEIVDAKMKIHQTMGTNLATIKHYLYTGSGNINKSLYMWNSTFNILENMNEENLTDDKGFDSFIKAANDMGIKVFLTGNLPDDANIIKIIIHIGKECLINAVLHAKADAMFFNVETYDDSYTIEISNNGENPINKTKDEIKSGGGFMSIQKQLNHINGRFEVNTDPTFSLKLYLPKATIF